MRHPIPLPEIDAMIPVSGFDDPIDLQETQALDAGIKTARKVFFVLNKADIVSEADRVRICSETSVRFDQNIRVQWNLSLHSQPTSKIKE